MLIGGLFAFFIILIITRNIILSFISIFSISGIVICVLGVVKLEGWYLGIIESVAATIVIGFSVDYVIHLVKLTEVYK